MQEAPELRQPLEVVHIQAFVTASRKRGRLARASQSIRARLAVDFDPATALSRDMTCSRPALKARETSPQRELD